MRFKFDSSNANWTNDAGFNRIWLKNMQNYLNDLFRCRGYLYQNQIYEWLGLEWNPENDNPCYTHNDYSHMTLELCDLKNGDYFVQIIIR